MTVTVPLHLKNRENYIKIGNALRTESHWMVQAGRIDQLSYNILLHLKPLSLLPAGLLSLMHCRYSELHQSHVSAIVNRHPLRITALKHSITRSIPSRSDHAHDLWQSCDPDTPIDMQSQDQLIRDIHRAAALTGIYMHQGAHSGTHIFRHLWASDCASRGWADDKIATSLGHKSPASTRQYLHRFTLIF